MQKDIFTEAQEDQIRKAFDRLDNELGLYNLDDDRDLERIFSKVQSTDSSQAWLDERLRFLEAKLTKLSSGIEALLDSTKTDLVSGINQQFEAIRTPAAWRREHASETIRSMELRSTETYDVPAFLRRQGDDTTENDISLTAVSDSINDPKQPTYATSIGNDLRISVDKLIEINLKAEKKQEESIRITESILRTISENFEEKLSSFMFALEKKGELIRTSESIAREDRDGTTKTSLNTPITSSPRQGNEGHKPKGGGGGFSLLGDILASPGYAFASFVLIVSLGLAFGFQASELNALKQVEDPLRGGKEIFQIVDSPVKAAQSFQNELISENIPYQIKFESKDKIKISIPVNEKTLLLASSRRIELPHESQCVLVFEKAK